MFAEVIQFIKDGWNDLKPVLFINQYENGVLLRAGKYNKVLLPGWWWKIPFVDSYHTENIMADTMDIPSVHITTLDNKTVSIGCEVEFKISDIHLAVIECNDWRTNVKDIVRGIISEHLEDCAWEDIKKKVVKNQISKKIEKRFSEMGVTLLYFNYTDKVLTKAITLISRPVDNFIQQEKSFFS